MSVSSLLLSSSTTLLSSLHSLVYSPMFIAFALALLLWTLYYTFYLVEKPLLYYDINSSLSNRLLADLPIVRDQFYYPLFWCTNAHLNAFLGLFLWHRKVLKFEERCYVNLADGGQISLDLLNFTGRQSNDLTPVLLVLHGLTGDSHDFTRLAAEAKQINWRTVAMNRRGHGNTPLLNRNLPSIARYSDIRAAIGEIRRRAPEAPIYAIGFSAGAGYLAAYLGLEDPQINQIKAAMFVSPGYSFRSILTSGVLNRFYDRILGWAIKRHLKQHHHILKDVSHDFEQAIDKLQTWSELEMNLGYKLAQINSLDEYIDTNNNPMKNFEKAEIPSLTMNAYDDPICVPQLIPFKQFSNSSTAVLMTTQRGSHTYWLTWSLWKPFAVNIWVHQVALDYFSSVERMEPNVKKLSYTKNRLLATDNLEANSLPTTSTTPPLTPSKRTNNFDAAIFSASRFRSSALAQTSRVESPSFDPLSVSDPNVFTVDFLRSFLSQRTKTLIPRATTKAKLVSIFHELQANNEYKSQ